MIKPGEIQTIANRQRVKDTQIEKDYIITWVLYGISNNVFLRDRILFKGGTVLKKCYFPDYRFSEDLDFTSMTAELDKDKLLDEFQAVFEWIYDESRIRLTLKDTTELNTGNINFYIGYIGPLGGDGTKKDLKVDISWLLLPEFSLYIQQLLVVVSSHWPFVGNIFWLPIQWKYP